ncbi:MAG: glycosyltransferase family 4 protein [Clostridium sp.]
MKTVIYFGNFWGDGGPAIVNRKIRENVNTDITNVIFMDDDDKKKRFKKLVYNFLKADVIHVSGINGIMSAIIVVLAKICFKKVTFSCHGNFKAESLRNNVFKKREFLIEKTYITFTNKIIVLSNTFLNEYKKYYSNIEKKAIVIPNGYTFDEKLYSRREKKEENKEFIITSLGGGRREKGNKKVCDVLNKINNENIKYVIIGEDGIDTDEIKEHNFVTYLGSISNEKVIDVLLRTNLFIQYSEFESFGIAPLEALNAGCDLIITDKMGVKEYINDSNFIVKYNDEVELYDKIIRKINNKDTDSKVCVPTWNEIANKYCELWNQ